MLTEIFNALTEGVFYGSISAIVAVCIAPLQFLKIIRQTTGTKYKTIFNNNYKLGGIKIFFRAAIPYGLMNFFSSLSFGISEYISACIISHGGSVTTLEVLLRALLGGLIETTCSIYFEVSEIGANKGIKIKKSHIAIIFIPIFLRNAIFWLGGIISFELSHIFDLSVLLTCLLAFCISILCSIFSITFDVIATQICGAKNHFEFFDRLKIVIKEGRAFSGLLMRFIQLGVFTIFTYLSMLIFINYL